MSRLILLACLIFAAVLPVSATVIMPRWPHPPIRPQEGGLEMSREQIKVTIANHIADAHITHTIRNRGNQMAEAEYLYPLPADATVQDFSVELDGKRLEAELLDAEKAEQVYRDIVRTMRDPGLLTYHDSRFLRVRAFPVPPGKEQKIELHLVWPLRFANGGRRLQVPLAHVGPGQSVPERDLAIVIEGAKTLTAPFSPTHPIHTRVDGNSVRVELDGNGGTAREFILVYGTGDKGIGTQLLTAHDRHSADNEAFMLLAAPDLIDARKTRIPRDIIFAFDTSGSMAGDKIRQAREALKYCLHQLEAGDRFALLHFATDVSAWQPELQPVTEEFRKEAISWVDELKARGGTDIAGALSRSAKFADGGRATVILFLTDGKPTVGEADPDALVARFQKELPARTRAFVFGVGEELNAVLLDRLAEVASGETRYVAPAADIEVTVSDLYDAISHPVLTSPELTINGITTSDVYPKKLPDLFAAGQLTVLGRYQGSGDATVKLTGEVDGQRKEWSWKLSFPVKGDDNKFVPPIWARRKIGHLLDSVRLNGESKELKDEITDLGRKYGVVTPYTSYLAAEDDPRPLPRPPRPMPVPYPGPRPYPGPPIYDNYRGDRRSMAPQASAAEAFGGADAAKSLSVQDGAVGVSVSQAITALKSADAVDASPAGTVLIRAFGTRQFRLLDGEWREDGVATDAQVTTVKWGSDAFFDLLKDDNEELRAILSLGDRILLRHNGKLLRIVAP